MRNYAEYARNSVRVWMRQVLDEKGWSANEWAIAAGTTPTNITRMLSPTIKSMPSVDTVCKLATAAGSQPNLIFGRATEGQGEKPPFNYCPECGFDLHSVTRPPRPKRASPHG